MIADAMERYREPPTPIAGSVLSTFVTKEGLIPLSCFTKKGEYFVLRSGEDEGFRPIFPTRALRAKLLDLIQNDEIPASAIQLAPSEFVKASDITSKELLTEEKLFGKVLTEDSFRKLIGRQFAVYAYPDDKDPRRALMTPLYELQYLLKSDNAKETSGLIEEVIDTTLNTNVNCDKYIFNHQGKQFVRDRLIHLVYDKVKELINHLDFSYLYYDANGAYLKRIANELQKEKVQASTSEHLTQMAPPYAEFRKKRCGYNAAFSKPLRHDLLFARISHRSDSTRTLVRRSRGVASAASVVATQVEPKSACREATCVSSHFKRKKLNI